MLSSSTESNICLCAISLFLIGRPNSFLYYQLLNTKSTLQQQYKDILTKWWVVILVARDPFLIYSTAAQIINIHHVNYRDNNHQQILTYKSVRSCLLTLFTCSVNSTLYVSMFIIIKEENNPNLLVHTIIIKKFYIYNHLQNIWDKR